MKSPLRQRHVLTAGPHRQREKSRMIGCHAPNAETPTPAGSALVSLVSPLYSLAAACFGSPLSDGSLRQFVSWRPCSSGSRRSFLRGGSPSSAKSASSGSLSRSESFLGASLARERVDRHYLESKKPDFGQWVTPSVLAGLAFYRRRISPHLSVRCRFEISCSAYMALAIAKHGHMCGLARGIGRLFSCHPWSSRPYWDAP